MSRPEPRLTDVPAAPQQEPAPHGQAQLDWRVEAASRLAVAAGKHPVGAQVVKVTVGPRGRLPALVFATPSPPALELNAAVEAARRAEDARTRLELRDVLGFDRPMQQVADASLPSLYDFLQDALVSVIFSYIAVETFANQEIRRLITAPRKVLMRGEVRLLEVADIERWVSTEDKLVQVLSVAAGVAAPRKSKWWPHFRRLARLRDDLAHLKEGRAYPRVAGGIPPASIFHELLTTDPVEYPRTAIQAIRHFAPGDPAWLAAAMELVESR